MQRRIIEKGTASNQEDLSMANRGNEENFLGVVVEVVTKEGR
jgi:hypothetical protein